MAEIKAGAPFGMDRAVIGKINWELALKRISHDLRTDFVYAPHLGFIYSKAGDELIAQVKNDLKSGQYSSRRTGHDRGAQIVSNPCGGFQTAWPKFLAPGSILLPHDRLLYQALADQAAPFVAKKTNPARSFSHQLAEPDSVSMFMPTRICWSALQKALARHARLETNKYILRIDVANFFGSLNLHTLINVLNDSGYADERRRWNAKACRRRSASPRTSPKSSRIRSSSFRCDSNATKRFSGLANCNM